MTAQSLYEELAHQERQPFLDRARDAVALTIPHLLPEEDPPKSGVAQELVQPYQSMGARGVNNIANKMLLALLPPNIAFFRLLLSSEMQATLQVPEQDAQAALAEMEADIVKEIETTVVRPRIFEALVQTVATGNALIQFDKKSSRVFRLDSFVINRDPNGNVLRIITHERIHISALPKDVKDLIESPASAEATPKPSINAGYGDDDTYSIYTMVERTSPGSYEETQWLGENLVPNRTRTYTDETLPYIPMRFHVVSGESYGRGHVEQYYGDLRVLEALSQAITEGSAAAAKVLIGCSAAAITPAEKLAKKPNLGFFDGEEGDYWVLKMEKNADFSVAERMIERLERRLGFAFMLNSTVSRHAERVTAEEIREVASELDDTLGGVFALQSDELQIPLVNIIRSRIQSRGGFPTLPRGAIKPAIVTGIDALGRGHELRRMETLFALLTQHFGAAVQEQFSVEKTARFFSTMLGVDIEDIVKTDEEVQQERMQAAAIEAIQRGAAPIAKEAAPEITEGIRQAAQQVTGAA